MKEGVIILALKKDSYALGAFNLALSIKHFNKDINITLISDNIHQRSYRPEHYAMFDQIKEMNVCDYTGINGFCPAKAKLNAYKYSDYKKTLFIDADSLVLQDIQPLFNKLKGSYKSNVIDGYTQWTSEEIFKSFFGVDFGCTVNSSWQYFEDNKVFEQANKYYKKGFNISDISPKWGNTLCDEIFVNASLTKLKIDPKVDYDVMFFGNAIDKRTYSEIEKDFYGFTLYGGQRTVRDIYITWYDKLCFKFCSIKGIEHRFKAHGILTGKHVQNK